MKRHAPESEAVDEADMLSFTPLGGGSEVGRSCHILKFKGKTIMLDCGLHPAYAGVGGLPFFDNIDPAEVDIILVTHFHLDHAAALPYFLEKTDFKGKVYMTHATKSIYKLILDDYVKVTNISDAETLYSQNDLLKTMDKITAINYHQVINEGGIKFRGYNAGHVLGAAMFMIEIAGVKLLYTGDYSRKEDRHLVAAETPTVSPDVLVVEATHGVQTLLPQDAREKRFTQLVHNILQRRGRCLIPVFALGIIGELLLILEEYWANNPSLQSTPIYYFSAMAKKSMAVYERYINMMNTKLQRKSQVKNPFAFKYIKNLKSKDALDDNRPCVVFASPGMMQNGWSRELFEKWCSHRLNGVVIPGYSVEGTMAKDIGREPKTIRSLTGQELPLHMSVAYVSFSQHADFQDTSEFVAALKPKEVILVHGERTKMLTLKRALLKKYSLEYDQEEEEEELLFLSPTVTKADVQGGEGDTKQAAAEDRFHMSIHTPTNCVTVDLPFRQPKIVKALGKLSARLEPMMKQQKLLQDGAFDEGEGHIHQQRVQGLLLKKEFEFTLLDAEELPEYSSLEANSVNQSLLVPFNLPFESLKMFVRQVFECREAALKDVPAGSITEKGKKNASYATLLVQELVRVTYHDADTSESKTAYVELHWESSPLGDMISDSLISLLQSAQNSPGAAKAIGVSSCCGGGSVKVKQETKVKKEGEQPGLSQDATRMKWYLERQFENVQEVPASPESAQNIPEGAFHLQVDGKLVLLGPEGLIEVKGDTTGDVTAYHIEEALKRVPLTHN